MNPFKPRRTFESVVRELVSGLEDGSIVLSKEADALQPQNSMNESYLYSGSLGMRMKASHTLSSTARHHRFVDEWVRVDLDTRTELPIDFGPIGR